MTFIEQAIEKAGGLKSLSTILGVDYQQVQYWRERGYISSYKGACAVAGYLGARVADVAMERFEKIGQEQK